MSDRATGGAAPLARDNPQRGHYDTIFAEYNAHYCDATSFAFRNEFILRPLLDGIDLTAQRVADLACGPGVTSIALQQLFPGVQLEGFDISPDACREYRTATGAPAHEHDLLMEVDGEPFDAAIVVGGLHHCILHLDRVLENVAGLLRPGGLFMLYEPNASFLLEGVRRRWYRRDRYFEADTEAAILPAELLKQAEHWFAPVRTFYNGGPAYFAILNSLVTRISLSAKPILAPPLFVAERAWNAVAPGWLKPAFGMILRRTD